MISIAQSINTKAFIAYYQIPETTQILCSPFSTTIGYALAHMTHTRKRNYVHNTKQLDEVSRAVVMDKYPEYFL